MMAVGVAICLHNAFKDPVDTNPFIDAACSSAADAACSFAADAAGSSLRNSTTRTDVLLLAILKLRRMYLKA